MGLIFLQYGLEKCLLENCSLAVYFVVESIARIQIESATLVSLEYCHATFTPQIIFLLVHGRQLAPNNRAEIKFVLFAIHFQPTVVLYPYSQFQLQIPTKFG